MTLNNLFNCFSLTLYISFQYKHMLREEINLIVFSLITEIRKCLTELFSKGWLSKAAVHQVYQVYSFANTAAHQEDPTGLGVSNSKDFLFLRLAHAADRKYGSQKIPAKNPISFKQSQSIYSISDLDLWVASVLSLMAVLKNGLGWQIGSPAISYLTTTGQHCKLFENYPGIFPGGIFVVTEKLDSPLAGCQAKKTQPSQRVEGRI